LIYLASITVLVCLLLLATVLGRRIADLLPDTFRDSIGFYISPLLGLAGIVLIATVYGWLSPFKTGLSISFSVGLLFLGIVFEKQRAVLFRDWLIISAFVIVATITILAPAIRFDSFNPFNDTFTYLVHGQWLQDHAFSETAKASGFFPAETQVALYQRGGLRMGGSFFLGFVQSLFHLEWSYYAYLPTVGFVFALGSLAIGGIIRQVVPVSKTLGLVLCALPAFSMNGFVFGAQFGFFPQTFGLAFAAGIACLLPGLINNTLLFKSTLTKQFFCFLPAALLCSALLISYNEIFPIISAVIGLFYLLTCLQYWSKKYQLIGAILILVTEVLALTNVEGFRILRSFLGTVLAAGTGAIHFGWPMYWSPIQFLAHSFGMKSPFQSDVFLIDRVVSVWVFPVLLIITVMILVKILREKPRNLTVLFLICTNIVIWMAFLKFRYLTIGLDGEIGNTFLQFKLAKWAAPFNLALLGITIARLLVQVERYKRLCTYLFLIILMTGMAYVQFVVIAQMFITQFQDETLRKESPFNEFLELRSRVANIPKEQVIYLGIPVAHHKLTQMVAYVLSDRKLSSNYEDGYMRGSIPAGELNMPMEQADWLLQHKPVSTVDENPLNRIGPFVIHRAPFAFYSLESITGAYGTETGDKKTWNWVKNSVEYRFHRVGKSSQVRVKFDYMGNPGILALKLSSATGEQVASFDIPMKVGWGSYESPLINSNPEDVIIKIEASGKPVRLSAGDPREVQFLIQNLSLESQFLESK